MGIAPTSASEAMDMVQAGLSYLAAADAASLTAEAQAECLRGLERADAISTAARASFLSVFTVGKGHTADADYSARAWLMHKTGITRGAVASHTAWAGRAVTHPRVVAALVTGDLQGRADAAGLITWDVSVDSTVARAHQPAAGARKNGDLQAERPGGVAGEPADHGLGRSRGGLTTKVHLACEQGQKPLSVVITAGQRGDSPQFQVVLGRIRVPRPGRGRPRTWPDRVRADKAYGSRANRAYLRRRGIRCTIPERPTRSATARPRAARVAARPPSTPKITKPATPWNAASVGSSATAPWPPATTSSPSATKLPSASPRSTNGSYPLLKHALDPIRAASAGARSRRDRTAYPPGANSLSCSACCGVTASSGLLAEG